tara:strand:+ start:6330 stop:6686 length:357 start_codon:yes stop_codon:yes gene_type:complete
MDSETFETQPYAFAASLRDVARLEVGGDTLREYTSWADIAGVDLHVQDAGRTLKIFLHSTHSLPVRALPDGRALSWVNRVEVIGNGREFVRYLPSTGVTAALTSDDKTLRISIGAAPR